MSGDKILIADDEEKIRQLLKMYLEADGFMVEEVSSGQEVLNQLKQNKWDLLVLDLMMPGINGWEVCREVRKASNIPIIMLTARGDEIDRVLGLELGADDYVVKPFSPRELVARVKALLRRAKGAGESDKSSSPKLNQEAQGSLHFPGLFIDPQAREVRLLDQIINLTPKEYDLLYHLASSPNRVFTREQLLNKIWGYDFYGDLRTVDTHINRLRDKLSHVAGATSYISTVWGVGYKFEVKE